MIPTEATARDDAAWGVATLLAALLCLLALPLVAALWLMSRIRH